MLDPRVVPAALDAPALRLDGADKVFSDGKRGIDPISLTVPAGEFLALIGPSGCGKSTLLRLMGRLLVPSGGTIRWWLEDFDRVGDLGRRLAFVFQEPTLMPWASVAANVRLPLDLAGERDADVGLRVAAALRQVELADRASSYPRQLSGGMRMRVSIARALVVNPNLLLMDEPFAALDEFSRNRLDEDLLVMSQERGLTVVFVTHSLYEAVFLSTRIVVMAGNPGRIFCEYSIDEPQPRGEEYRLSDRFAAHCRRLSVLLNEASRSMRDPF